ncbi:hypothetical protein LINPERPRIM_LOCUS36749 [Linum perenne]
MEEQEDEEEYEMRRELTDDECEGTLSSTMSEESEVDYWPFKGSIFQIPHCFDVGYISNKESLIETALPDGQREANGRWLEVDGRRRHVVGGGRLVAGG